MVDARLTLIDQSEHSQTVLDTPYDRFLLLLEEHEKVSFEHIEVVFVTSEEIVRINKEYLSKDYVTDIISFRIDDEPDEYTQIEGVICICSERVIEQAEEYETSINQEFARVVVHGLLHFCSYDDHTVEQKNEMRQKENFYLEMMNLL